MISFSEMQFCSSYLLCKWNKWIGTAVIMEILRLTQRHRKHSKNICTECDAEKKKNGFHFSLQRISLNGNNNVKCTNKLSSIW